MKKSEIVIIAGLALLAVAVMATSENSDHSVKNAINMIKLPAPRTDGGIPLEKTLLERRSIRSFKDQALTLDEVSQLLWAAQGVTDDKGHRTAPSAMARYPLEVYLLAGNITGLPSGVYHYSPQGHNLTVITQGKIDEYYNASAGFEAWIKTAPAIFVITGSFDRTNTMPGRDLSGWVYIEAGAAAENLLLEVVSLDLAATYTAGFDANKTKELLGLTQDEEIIGVIPVGVGRTA